MAHKIQIKRGNKADLPTLDVGEFGLCQDTNELFIGNSGNQKIFPPTAMYIDVTNYPTLADAIAYATTLIGQNPTLYFPRGIGIETTSTVTIPAGINVIMDSPLIYAGVANEPCLVIGETGVSNRVELKIRVTKKVQSDWSNEDCIGVKIFNADTSKIDIKYATKFTIGVQFIGSGKGFAYNETRLGFLYDNKISLDCTNELNGWCNENSYYGGRFSNLTTTNTGLSRYGVRITSKDGLYTNNNNNVFYKPSFELKVPTSGEAIPILIEHGNLNEFKSIRNEGNSSPTVRITNNSTANEITSGYGDVVVEDLSMYPNTKSSARREQIFTDVGKVIFLASDLHKKACYYDGDSKVNIPTVHIGTSGNSSVLNSGNNITLNENYLGLSSTRAVGIFVNTAKYKRFVVRRDVEASNPGRVAIRCYDANGNVLDSSGPNHPYVRGIAPSPPYYSTNFGGTYRMGSDSPAAFYFKVHDDVKKIAVLVGGGSSSCYLRGFSIECLDGFCSTWAGYEEIIPGCNIGIAAPTAGTWKVGRRVVRIPKVGLPKAWICTVAGTPGTWVSEGDL